MTKYVVPVIVKHRANLYACGVLSSITKPNFLSTAVRLASAVSVAQHLFID